MQALRRLLLIDFAMPGMTGAEVAARVRQSDGDTPIIFASGYAETAALGTCGTRIRPSREHPHISLDVERESADIAQAIASGIADLGFAAEHTLPDTIERFPFSTDRLVVVTAQRSEFAGRRLIDFREIIDRDFIGLTSSTALQSHIGEYAARRCARATSIAIVRLRDPWANRKLAICYRSLKTMPRPARLLVDHLHKAAQC